jgi:hypothetical protein
MLLYPLLENYRLIRRHCRPEPRKRAMDISLTAQRCGWYIPYTKIRSSQKTNAADASIFLIFANLDHSKGYKGITCFVAEKEWGVEIAKKEKKVTDHLCIITYNPSSA